MVPGSPAAGVDDAPATTLADAEMVLRRSSELVSADRRDDAIELLSVFNRRLVSLLRRFDCFAGRFHIFGRRGCTILNGWRWFRDGLRRFDGRRRGDERWGGCNRNRRLLFHFRLGKVLTRAQENARD